MTEPAGIDDVTEALDEAERSCKGGEGCHLKSAAVPVPGLRQALWDIYAATGADTDGQRSCPAPGVLTPDVHMLALEEVSTLRRDYTAALGEIPGAGQVAVSHADLRRYLDATEGGDPGLRETWDRLSAAAGDA